MIREKLNRRLPDAVTAGYGTVYISTERGLHYMDELADWKHTQRTADVGVAVFLLSMIVAIGVLASIAVSVLRSPPEPTAAQEPMNLLAVPGLNEFLPLSATVYILIALFIAAGVHELAHGVAMRAEGVTVEEVGIALLVVFPIAAYVMPDEEEYETAGVRSRARILSAGVFANLIVFAITSALFLLPGTGSAIDAFMTYFGAAVGGELPQQGDVAALGAVTNVLFWTWFFNINLAFVNVLPAVFLDGGRVAGLLAEFIDVEIPTPVVSKVIVAVTTFSTVGVFVLAVFGPLLLRG